MNGQAAILFVGEEEWRRVPSFPDIWASSLGRVRVDPQPIRIHRGGIRMGGGKPTYGSLNVKANGYARYQFAFYRNGKRERFFVHRLVCEAFHGPCPEGKTLVLHEDENSLNNRPGNLKWGTPKENNNYPGVLAYRSSRTGENSNWAVARRKAGGM